MIIRLFVLIICLLFKSISAFKIGNRLVYNSKLKFSKENNYDIRRETRAGISGLSLIGGVETSYLTWIKFTDQSSFANICNGESCKSVLTGPFSMIPYLDIPLTLVGAVAYSFIFLLAILPLFFSNSDLAKEKYKISLNSSLLLSTSTIMATFSIYLLGLLTFSLHTSCNYW